MKKVSSVHVVLYVIGFLTVATGLFALFTNPSSDNYLYALFIGVSLIGSAYYDSKNSSIKSS